MNLIDNKRFKNFLPKTKSKQSQFKKEVLEDFWVCLVSREVSILARREVLTGKAKFGVTGDGKELAQIAMAKAFKKGDFHAGYYREQTFMFSMGLCTLEAYFAQLYADSAHDPFSGGRQMNNHFATSFIDEEGNWLDLKNRHNISAGISSTAGQIARAVGLGLASKKFRSTLKSEEKLSDNGNEVVFSTIGDASTSEGVFLEAINASSVLKIPVIYSVWDDGFGISVPIELQTTKSSISDALRGFEWDGESGIYIEKVKGWDYPGLCAAYETIAKKVRESHIPALVHVHEMTQPQGHSTSGSHERYKSKSRLAWEKEYDCINRMAEWMVKAGIIETETIEELRIIAKELVKEKRNLAWSNHREIPNKLHIDLVGIYEIIPKEEPHYEQITELHKEVTELVNPAISEIIQNAKRVSYLLSSESLKEQIISLCVPHSTQRRKDLQSNLYSSDQYSALKVPVVHPAYDEESEQMNGFRILNNFFKIALEKYPNVFAFGEDVGHIGDVNQGFAGLQEEFGEDRVFDCGIREWTIMGQVIGMAMRGLRPIGEIQYLDYIFYGLTPLVDDLSTLRYRTNGLQAAPAIIRTRGHRLEGIWHTGSPMAVLINSLKGIYILTPRNMVQACGMYNTMLQSNDPAVIVECLNGYRIKEICPTNIGEYTVPLGCPEIIHSGNDLTLVTYGSCVRIAIEAIKLLSSQNISIELIDIQTLVPFDLEHTIVESLKKTNRVLFLDEDVPGGATAYLMREVLEVQNGYQYLDARPRTITAKDHRTPYGSDGDYFCKPNPEEVYEVVLEMMKE